ncbi:MAG: transglutaminase family protein, partial [Agitococcus sp.]|nr:transglutaminase family protein [Agitococcus sp.]
MNTSRRARYRITHETRYRYAANVTLSQQLLHLQPRDMPYQTCIAKKLTISPEPSYSTSSQDSFGNPCTRLEFNQPHRELVVIAEMDVDVFTRDVATRFETSPAWEEMVSACLYRGHVALTGDFLEALPFRFESPFVHLKHQFSDYAQDCFFKDRPLLVAIQALMSKIYHEFTFDPEATHIG